MTARRLLTLSEAAEHVGTCPRTIRRWISAGRVKGYRAGPRLLRVDLAELDAMLTALPTAGMR